MLSSAMIILCAVCLLQAGLNVWLCAAAARPPGPRARDAQSPGEAPDGPALKAEKQWADGFQNLMTYSMADAMRKDGGLEREN